jgi:hypothetical protein
MHFSKVAITAALLAVGAYSLPVAGEYLYMILLDLLWLVLRDCSR